MSFSIIYMKTAKGAAEVRARSNVLTPVARRVLIMVDGKRSEIDLAPVVREGELDAILATLRSLGMIEECGVADVPAADFPDDEQTVMDVESTARLELGIVPGVAMPPPPTLRVPLNERPATLANTPSPLFERRAAPAAAQPIPPAAAAVPPMQPAAVRAPASAATPSFPSGALAGPPAAAVAAAPTPSAAPSAITAGSGTLRRVVVAAPAPAPAPPPVVAAPSPSLEEAKRAAVRALYERLGPYGEEPAARIQDCKSVEALREQLAHACKRITTFRGEAAAREYMATLNFA